MEPPIILDNRGDIYIFLTKAAAEEYMEPADVVDNYYVAYDSQGRLLHINVEKGCVLIRDGDVSTSHADELRRILVRYLAYMKMPAAGFAESSLQDLIQKQLECERQYWYKNN